MKLLAIDFERLSVLLLPTFLRIPVIMAFLRSFMNPFSYLQDLFFANRASNLYMLKYNGQVCHLRKVLNDAFPARNKTFIIDDYAEQGEFIFAWDETEIDKQLMIKDTPSVIVYSVEIIGDYANFVVKIPVNLRSIDNLNRIKAITNTYKLLSKKAVYGYY